MAENNRQEGLFRKKTLDRISSPDQLTEYLHVTNPGIWLVLAAVIILIAGLLAWSVVGTLETEAPVRVVVEDNTAQVIPLEGDTLSKGMSLYVSDQEFVIASVKADSYGRSVGQAQINFPDGFYDGTVVTEVIHPIEFLLESR